MRKINSFLKYNKNEINQLEKINSLYIDFLNKCKTERECVNEIILQAENAGFINIEKIIAEGRKLSCGDKVFAVHMKKTIILLHIGEYGFSKGLNILSAHLDSPRLDIKQNPIFEDDNLVFLDTHYYGGIKKYQWVSLPLALHGVVIKKDGTVVDINIGDGEDDPVFCITDLLIHLSKDQMKKSAHDVIEGENLNILFGSIPCKCQEKNAIKINIIKILKEQYNMEEDDFLSAEIEVVPAGRARELGLDKSMIISYGQDDRAGVFTTLRAMLDVKYTQKTNCCIFVDKEEIGNIGATSMNSKFFENTIFETMNLFGIYSEIEFRRVLQKSRALSSDVSPAFDPIYRNVFEKNNSAFISYGIVFNKYIGSNGKSGSNDANAEYLAKLRMIMDKNSINYQTAELGKVDCGGGGSISHILAQYGMEVIDCGISVLNMHAPWEITSKADIYEATKGYKVFLEDL